MRPGLCRGEGWWLRDWRVPTGVLMGSWLSSGSPQVGTKPFLCILDPLYQHQNVYWLGQERMRQDPSPARGSLVMGGWVVPDPPVMGLQCPSLGHGQAAQGTPCQSPTGGWRCGGAVGHILRGASPHHPW